MSLLIRISIWGTDKQTDKLFREKHAKEQKGSIIFHVMGSIRVRGIFLAHWCEFCSKSRQNRELHSNINTVEEERQVVRAGRREIS